MIQNAAGTLRSRLNNYALAEMQGELLEHFADFFRLLSDETRLRILTLLQQKEEMDVTALCKELKQSQPTVSHHLGLLYSAALIQRRRDGKHNFYRLTPHCFRTLFNALNGAADTAEPMVTA